MSETRFRRDRITRPLFGWARRALPGLSETEREALNAGDIWWDAELFSGNPDWSKLRETESPRLSAEERDFLDGPVEELCAMVDDWRISWETGDLPEEVWAHLKRHRFFGMIIPKEYGGLGFSAFAHSEVIRKISTRSLVATVTVMVPNSLGPGELLMQFGTEAQRKHWLPRLATGEEIPCFGLTSPEAGSDAAAMNDTGVICRGKWNGEDTLGIRLNWDKRYITLAPVATLLGLAFKLSDPEGLLGGEEELGITLALVPTDLPGVEIGRRHLPALQYFQNGPTQGRDVFIPLDHVIGGKAQLGKGWTMLMSALAAGRGISLPSQSAAATAICARTTGSYARVREQFGIPIGKFEGVAERVARLAATSYTLDAARRLTCAGLDEGRKLAVISAIMKAHATERMRIAVTDAMDVHAGKAVIDGPSNYLGIIHRSVPVGITVEGANILTRYMIIFGQGAIRCHPFLLKEMLALETKDEEAALEAFDAAFWGHVAHSLKTFGRAWLRSWTGGLVSPAPSRAGKLRRYYRQLSRYAAGFALAADIALLTLGGALKRRELLSARLGDILSELYLLSAVAKRWEDDGRKAEDLPLLRHAMAEGFATIQHRFAGVIANLPNRPAAWLLKAVVQPMGLRARGPSDKLVNRCAELLMTDSEARERLKGKMYLGEAAGPVRDLEDAFKLVTRAEAIERRVAQAGAADWREGHERGLLTEDEVAIMTSLEEAVDKVIAVDDFAPEELAPRRRREAVDAKRMTESQVAPPADEPQPAGE